MRAYLSAVDAASDRVRRVVVEDPVRVYRSGYDVVAEVNDQAIDLDVDDMTVSAKQDGRSPVAFVPRADAIEIRNEGSTNPILVTTGVGDREIHAGDAERVSGDCTVTVGSSRLRLMVERTDPGRETLSVEEFKRELRMRQDGALLGGVSVSEYVPILAELLLKARRESPGECLKYASELRVFLADHPVDDDEYDAVVGAVEDVVTKLDTKVTALPGTDLDDEHNGRIDRVVHRVQRLYARSGS